jgi:hypothetical protein
MRIHKKYIVSGRDPVYVVTRDNRRSEEQNYKVKYDAEERAEELMRVVKEYDPRSIIGIVFTSQPERIR